MNLKSPDYYQNILERCKYLDTLSFRTNLREIKEILKDSESPDWIKIALSDWILRRIYTYYKTMDGELKEIIDNIIPSIERTTEIVSKSTYLKFKDYRALEELCKKFFLERFKNHDAYFILQMMNDTKLISISDLKLMREHFINWIKTIKNFEQRSNLLDVLLRYFNSDPDIKKIYETMKWENSDEKKPHNIYTDNQNAHDTNIDSSALQAAENLILDIDEIKKVEIMDKYEGEVPINREEDKEFYKHIIIETFFNKYSELSKISDIKNVIQCVITRMRIDDSVYTTEKVRFNLLDLFDNIQYYIENVCDLSIKDELLKRMYQELDSMKELCPTGYVNRTMNMFNGYVERYQISISFEQQLNAILTYKISKHIENEATDNVIYGTCDPEYKQEYVDFVVGIVNKYLSSIIKDYGREDVEKYIILVMAKISGISKESFHYKNDIVSAKII